MLGDAVVVARDGSGPDIGARADASIADIGEMIGLGAGVEPRLLYLDEIADVNVGVEICAGSQPREWPDPRTATHMGTFKMGKRTDERAILDRHAGSEHHIGLDRDVTAEPGVGAQVDRI